MSRSCVDGLVDVVTVPHSCVDDLMNVDSVTLLCGWFVWVL